MSLDTPKKISVIEDTKASDERFMFQALVEARIAGDAGDVPVGAIVVAKNEIVARAHNQRQISNDPTAHAEVLALRAASLVVGSWHISGTMYVTQEPCVMCAGALVNARVTRLVYGCKNPKSGAVSSLYSIVCDSRLNHRMPVTDGILGHECADLLTDFFKKIRGRC